MKPAGWRNGLIDLVESLKRKPMIFGISDCAVGLAFPAIRIQTGVDLGEPYRGQYGTFLEGVKLCQRAGFSSLADMIEKSGFASGHPAQAQYGDIASMPSEHPGWALGIVLRDHIGVYGVHGYEIVPNRLSALQTFRVK